MICVGCDRVGVEVRGGGGGARPGDRIDHVEILEGGHRIVLSHWGVMYIHTEITATVPYPVGRDS